MEKFKVIIAGGRDFNDYQLLKEKCLYYLQNKLPNVEIVSGTANGADKLGEQFGEEHNLNIERFPAKWKLLEGDFPISIGTNGYGKKYNKLAGHNRNREMYEYADALIAFHDGKSTGTKNMIETSKKLRGGKFKVIVVNY